MTWKIYALSPKKFQVDKAGSRLGICIFKSFPSWFRCKPGLSTGTPKAEIFNSNSLTSLSALLSSCQKVPASVPFLAIKKHLWLSFPSSFQSWSIALLLAFGIHLQALGEFPRSEMGKEPLFKQQHWPVGLKSGCPAILSHSTKIWFKAVLGSVCLAEGRGAPWNVVWKTDAECWRGWLAEVGQREWSLLLDAGASDDESASRNAFQGELFCMEPVSVHAQLLSWVWLFVTPMDRGTHQAPLSMGFFRQK